jgi:hypothetical protein
MVEVEDIYKNLRNGKHISLLSIDDIKKIQKPIGKAIFKDSITDPKKSSGRPRKPENEKAHHRDRLICNICGEKYYRSYGPRHKKTKLHQAYEKMNHKIYKLLLDIDE